MTDLARQFSKPRAIVAGLMVLVCSFASPARAVDDSPYDVLETHYAPYTVAGDPLGFPLKVSSLTDSRYKFWRGTKDLYYHWAKTEAADWLADAPAYVVCHGDLHPGNIGSYATGPGTLAVGWVDFDDSARLPFQLELLHGVISFHLAGDAIGLSAAQQDAASAALFDSYRQALTGDRSTAALLAGNSQAEKLLSKAGRAYDTGDFLDDAGKFKPAIVTKKGKVKEVLRPADESAGAVAAALSKAAGASPALRPPLRVKSVVQRTRVGSSGSQGLTKYLVLLDRPLNGVDGDAILYLKQQIPSAAERAGIVTSDDATASPADRATAHMLRVLDPAPWVCAAVELAGKSYWLSVKEPWSEELDPEDADGPAELTEMARVWGTVTGVAHRRGGDAQAIAGKLTPELRDLIARRATEYTTELTSAFDSFRKDERVRTDIATVRAALDRAAAVAQDTAAPAGR